MWLQSRLHVAPWQTLPAMKKTQVWSLDREDPLNEGNGNPLQYSCLENSIDSGAWRAVVHGAQKSQTLWLNNNKDNKVLSDLGGIVKITYLGQLFLFSLCMRKWSILLEAYLVILLDPAVQILVRSTLCIQCSFE